MVRVIEETTGKVEARPSQRKVQMSQAKDTDTPFEKKVIERRPVQETPVRSAIHKPTPGSAQNRSDSGSKKRV